MASPVGASPLGTIYLGDEYEDLSDPVAVATVASPLGDSPFGTFYYADEFKDVSTATPPVVTVSTSAVGPVLSGAPSATAPPIGPVVGGQAVVQIRAGVLGCGEYRAAIEPLGGGFELIRLAWSAISFSRAWTSTGEIHISVNGVTRCSAECQNLQSLRPWRHELVILRDGVEVARGPLIIAETQGDSAELTGQDMSGWLAHRVLHEVSTPLTPQDASSVAVSIVFDAMTVDQRPGLVGVYKGDTGVKVAPELVPLNQTSIDALQNLVQSGVAWTTIGREILIGPANLMGPDSVATFRTGDFADSPKVTGSGALQANSWIIQPDQQAAETTDDTAAVAVAVVGRYTDPLAAFEDGVLERIGRDPGVITTEDANLVAFRNTQITRNTPLLVEGGTLAREAGVTIDKLIPGSLMTVEDAGCFPFAQVVRLTGVQVNAKPGDEEVAVSFSPIEETVGT